MKVVHFVWSLTNGGIENMLTDIIRYQVNKAEVLLVIMNNKISDSILNRIDSKCHVHIIGRPPKSRNPFYIAKLNLLLWKVKADVHHFHCDLYKYVKVPARAKVFTAHNLSWGEKHVTGMDKCAAISSAVYKNLVENWYTNAVQIDNGIDFSLVRQRNRVFDGTLRVVQTGRLIHQYKGQDLLIDAVDRLVRQGITDVHVDFMGDGESRAMLEDMVKTKGLENYVTFIGDCDRNFIYEHLADYDLFVQPARWEGFGLTVAEAVAAKLPVVIAKHEGPLQIIDGGKYGNVFDIENVDGLVKQLLAIKNDYPKDKMLNEAYNYAKSNFGIEKTAQRYIELYYQIRDNNQ